MNKIQYIEPSEHILIISDLVDQIVQVNKIIALHREHDADVYDTKQYLYIREEKMERLNNLLGEFQLEMSFKEKAA